MCIIFPINNINIFYLHIYPTTVLFHINSLFVLSSAFTIILYWAINSTQERHYKNVTAISVYRCISETV